MNANAAGGDAGAGIFPTPTTTNDNCEPYWAQHQLQQQMMPGAGPEIVAPSTSSSQHPLHNGASHLHGPMKHHAPPLMGYGDCDPFAATPHHPHTPMAVSSPSITSSGDFMPPSSGAGANDPPSVPMGSPTKNGLTQQQAHLYHQHHHQQKMMMEQQQKFHQMQQQMMLDGGGGGGGMRPLPNGCFPNPNHPQHPHHPPHQQMMMMEQQYRSMMQQRAAAAATNRNAAFLFNSEMANQAVTAVQKVKCFDSMAAWHVSNIHCQMPSTAAFPPMMNDQCPKARSTKRKNSQAEAALAEQARHKSVSTPSPMPLATMIPQPLSVPTVMVSGGPSTNIQQPHQQQQHESRPGTAIQLGHPTSTPNFDALQSPTNEPVTFVHPNTNGNGALPANNPLKDLELMTQQTLLSEAPTPNKMPRMMAAAPINIPGGIAQAQVQMELYQKSKADKLACLARIQEQIIGHEISSPTYPAAALPQHPHPPQHIGNGLMPGAPPHLRPPQHFFQGGPCPQEFIDPQMAAFIQQQQQQRHHQMMMEGGGGGMVPFHPHQQQMLSPSAPQPPPPPGFRIGPIPPMPMGFPQWPNTGPMLRPPPQPLANLGDRVPIQKIQYGGPNPGGGAMPQPQQHPQMMMPHPHQPHQEFLLPQQQTVSSTTVPP